jgi:1-acyl-sn-glycerol-3-phosphate acyltransferase
MLYVLAYYLLKPLFKLLFRLKIKGQQHLPKEGPFIVASNHASYLDPILLGLAVYPKRVKFMAKAELFRLPVFNLLISQLGAFPVKREMGQWAAIKTASQILKTKGVLGIFPEGTRHKDKLGPAQLGAALVALKTKAPIIPVAIKGTNLVWPPGSRRF